MTKFSLATIIVLQIYFARVLYSGLVDVRDMFYDAAVDHVWHDDLLVTLLALGDMTPL